MITSCTAGRANPHRLYDIFQFPGYRMPVMSCIMAPLTGKRGIILKALNKIQPPISKRGTSSHTQKGVFFPSKRWWLYERGSVNAYHTHLQSDSAYHPNSVRSARCVSLPITIEEKRDIVYQGKRFTREPVIVQKDIHGSKVHEAHTEREKRQITYKQRHARRHLNNLLRGKQGVEGWRLLSTFNQA